MTEIAYGKVKRGEIVIPKYIVNKLGFKSGERVRVEISRENLKVTPGKKVTDKLNGALKLHRKIIDELIENEELYEAENY
jgi:antitoxin component of MazEF toxin-antitoxin module